MDFYPQWGRLEPARFNACGYRQFRGRTINIIVGMFNLFTMLPLDGGHVAIAIYERIRSKRGRRVYHADITKLMPVAYVFLAFVVVLGLSALYVNIVQPASLPGG